MCTTITMRRVDIEAMRLKDGQWIEMETSSGRKRTQFREVTDAVLITVDGTVQLSNVRAIFYA